ncbi:hypothetical protein ACPWSR_09060 [Alloiococcus sp. CFN-8]|uniref:hypothetical protein n=1 Tax=Alloiococcus sp. CFN-8 TaxID=3416081 RepID=UPI003CE88588
MDNFTKEHLIEALRVVASTISRCEKIQPKFAEGTSQHTLLRNRIKALYISKALIAADSTIDTYTREELMAALPPVSSIISKTEKAQSKYEEGTAQYKRFEPTIKAMKISKSLIEYELFHRENKSPQ